MIHISLKRLLLKKEVSFIVREIMALLGTPVFVQDSEGRVLLGNAGEGCFKNRHPIKLGERVIGWVNGGERALVLASLLSYLATVELEKKAIGREALEKYKEITLLYDITEKLTASLNPKDVAQLVVDQAKRLIRADYISVMLINEDTGMLEVVAVSGEGRCYTDVIEALTGIKGNVVHTGKPEIINDILSDSRYVRKAIGVSSLMCVPLKVKDRVIGLIIIGSRERINYTAEDMKLLSALAFQAAADIENARLYDSLKETFLTTIHTLAETIEKRDPYTGGHTKRVMNYSLAIGSELGLSEAELERLQLAAVLHDIGKIGIRDGILLKKRKLSFKEFEEIKMHTIYAEQILNHIKNLKKIIPGVKHHHERFDGKGYPEGLQGDGIDVIARIIAVADAFDAMTTDRPYRKSLGLAVALEELRKNAGTQFDPDVVKAFMKAYESEKLLSKEADTDAKHINSG